MLSQLLFVRLKAAENALRDGRLDEAYRLATAPDIREHRRGATVLAGLAEEFLERARVHYRADRFTEAAMDLDKAEQGGVLTEEIAELRGHIKTVSAEQQRREQTRRERVDAARRRIEGGSLAAGRRILENASATDNAAQQLRKHADQRSTDVKSVVEQAERLLSQGQIASAVKRIAKAKSIDAQYDRVIKVEARLCKQVFQSVQDAIRNGRLARASDELACLGDLGESLPARRELSDHLALAKKATECVANGSYADARQHMMSLARLIPKAAWVRNVADQLGEIEELRTGLFSGPLGERMQGEQPNARNPQGSPRHAMNQPGAANSPRNLDDTVVLPNRSSVLGGLPERLLMLVDGGGSYVLLRGDSVSMGRAAAELPADVPVFSDIAERHANINRVDDDYFLFSAKEAEVAGHKTQHQLLRHGDRVILGRKAKFTFRIPSRKSATAVLDLSDTTKMPHDVRRVVMFRHHATVGDGPSAHIQCRHAGTPLVLFERNGELWLRQKSDGHVDTSAVKLTLGKPIEFAGVSLVLEPWQTSPPGGRKL